MNMVLITDVPNSKGGNGAGATPKGTQLTPGALGKGLTISSALSLLFKFLAYTVPIFGFVKSFSIFHCLLLT